MIFLNKKFDEMKIYFWSLNYSSPFRKKKQLFLSHNCPLLFTASATFYNKLGRIPSDNKLLFYTGTIFSQNEFSLSSESKLYHKFLRIRNNNKVHRLKHIKVHRFPQKDRNLYINRTFISWAYSVTSSFTWICH